MELAYEAMRLRQQNHTAERVFEYVILLTKVDKLSYSDIIASLKKAHQGKAEEGVVEQREIKVPLQAVKKKGTHSRWQLMEELKERSYLVEQIQDTWRRITSSATTQQSVENNNDTKNTNEDRKVRKLINEHIIC
jgi:hypothetical protein